MGTGGCPAGTTTAPNKAGGVGSSLAHSSCRVVHNTCCSSTADLAMYARKQRAARFVSAIEAEIATCFRVAPIFFRLFQSLCTYLICCTLTLWLSIVYRVPWCFSPSSYIRVCVLRVLVHSKLSSINGFAPCGALSLSRDHGLE